MGGLVALLNGQIIKASCGPNGRPAQQMGAVRKSQAWRGIREFGRWQERPLDILQAIQSEVRQPRAQWAGLRPTEDAIQWTQVAADVQAGSEVVYPSTPVGVDRLRWTSPLVRRGYPHRCHRRAHSEATGQSRRRPASSPRGDPGTDPRRLFHGRRHREPMPEPATERRSNPHPEVTCSVLGRRNPRLVAARLCNNGEGGPVPKRQSRKGGRMAHGCRGWGEGGAAAGEGACQQRVAPRRHTRDLRLFHSAAAAARTWGSPREVVATSLGVGASNASLLGNRRLLHTKG